jgi:hypothetical protein
VSGDNQCLYVQIRPSEICNYVKSLFWTLPVVQIIKLQRFESWILLSSSGKWGGGGTVNLSVGLVGSGPRLAQPGGPTDRFSGVLSPFLPDDESRIQFSKRNFII